MMYKSIARAAASKAGPRLAEVAGRARCSGIASDFFLFSDIGVRGIRFLGSFQSLENRVQIGIEHNRRMAQ